MPSPSSPDHAPVLLGLLTSWSHGGTAYGEHLSASLPPCHEMSGTQAVILPEVLGRHSSCCYIDSCLQIPGMSDEDNVAGKAHHLARVLLV